jgi:uncharacterized glyoxalase superfamily metalloenzyme YdcJ
VHFAGEDGTNGAHTARFGEIEQRGIALTRKGRALYDSLLQSVRDIDGGRNAAPDYESRLAQAFTAFPDDLDAIRHQGLGFIRCELTPAGGAARRGGELAEELEDLIASE